MSEQNNQTSLAVQNATEVSYALPSGESVTLDMDFVARYLVSGRSELITAQELVMFMGICKQQKLNPLAKEAFLVKYSESEPAQAVIGKSAYMRRAFENPNYSGKQDGIVVERNGNIIQKEGTCLYPGEKLIGGWCRIFFLRNGAERTSFRELALDEYNKSKASWKDKPATMINKCAIAQAIRDAFPTDFNGLYTEEEMVASGAIPSDYNEVPGESVVAQVDIKATQEEKHELLEKISALYPAEEKSNVLKDMLESVGCDSMSKLTKRQLAILLSQIGEEK